MEWGHYYIMEEKEERLDDWTFEGWNWNAYSTGIIGFFIGFMLGFYW